MFELRPAARDDEAALLRVLAARDEHDFGLTDYTRDLLLGQWRMAEFDPGADAIVAEDDDVLVGFGAVFTPGSLAFVDPGHEGRGIGTALLAWVEARARELGRETHRQPVAHRNLSGQALLQGAGYRQVRAVLRMERAIRGPLPVPPAPGGISLHELDVARDAEALHAADRAAFADNPDYEPESLEAFRHEHLENRELDPGLSRVARRGASVAGFTLCRRADPRTGYIDLLAVEEGERGRGLGTVLLLTAFASFAHAGLHDARLEVASDNPGALRLYERVGMTPRDRLDVFEKPERRRGSGIAA